MNSYVGNMHLNTKAWNLLQIMLIPIEMWISDNGDIVLLISIMNNQIRHHDKCKHDP